MINALVMVLLFVTAVFLILLVLVQRGRGGGLAGAFGGMGGQSAFGTKAGDLFTRITIGVAAFWIILCAASVKLLSDANRTVINLGTSSATVPAPAGGAEPVQPKAGPTGAPADSGAKSPAGSATGPSTPASAPAVESTPAAPEKAK